MKYILFGHDLGMTSSLPANAHLHISKANTEDNDVERQHTPEHRYKVK